MGSGSVIRPIRAIALAIPTLAMLLVIASAVLFTQDGVFGGDPVSNALGLVGIACYVVIGGLIAWRIPENACGWLLLLVGGGLAAAVFSDALATYGLREGFVTLASWADWANAVLFFVTLAGIPLYLGVPHGASRRRAGGRSRSSSSRWRSWERSSMCWRPRATSRSRIPSSWPVSRRRWRR